MISQELLLSFKCARCQKSRPSGLVGFQLRPRAHAYGTAYEKYQDGERVLSRFMIKPCFALVFALHLASYNRHPESETEPTTCLAVLLGAHVVQFSSWFIKLTIVRVMAFVCYKIVSVNVCCTKRYPVRANAMNFEVWTMGGMLLADNYCYESVVKWNSSCKMYWKCSTCQFFLFFILFFCING